MASRHENEWLVFTKPWKNLQAVELAELVSKLGFNGIELPVRPGFQVEPDSVETGLKLMTQVFTDHGLSIGSIASTPNERIMAACAENGIGIIRIMVPVSEKGYLPTSTLIRESLDQLLPLCEKHGVKIGIQPHYDFYISDSIELSYLLSDYDPRFVGAIWDAAHDGLARKSPEFGLARNWPWLIMANFKNAYPRRIETEGKLTNGWDSEPFFTDGPDGLARWDLAANYLIEHDYRGPICLPAEYSDETNLESRVANDLKYIKALMGEGNSNEN